MQNRIDHLTRGGTDHTGKLDNRKFKWLPRTQETLENAQFKVKADNCLGYVRRYEEGYHIVLVSPDGVAYYEEGIDNALVSQFKESFGGKKGDYEIVWESGPWASAPSVLPVSYQSSALLHETDRLNIPQDQADVNPSSEKKLIKPSVTVPDGDLFTWANENPQPASVTYTTSIASTNPLQHSRHSISTMPQTHRLPHSKSRIWTCTYKQEKKCRLECLL